MAPAPVWIRPPDPRRRAGPTRRVLHWLVCGAGWAAFAWSWVVVWSRARGSEVAFTAAFLTVSLVIIAGVTALWVAHNVSIAERKRRRVGTKDRVTPIGTLSQPDVVHVSLEGERKMYRAGDAAALDKAKKEAA